MGPRDRRLPVGVPADRDLADHPHVAGQTGRPPRVVPRVDEVLVRLDGDEMVGELGEGFDRTVTGDRRGDVHRRLGQIPQPRGVDLEVLTAPVDDLTGEQFADDLDGFAQHVLATGDRRPPLADYVFVEVLAGAEAEGEATVGEDLQCRGLLRDDRGW